MRIIRLSETEHDGVRRSLLERERHLIDLDPASKVCNGRNHEKREKREEFHVDGDERSSLQNFQAKD